MEKTMVEMTLEEKARYEAYQKQAESEQKMKEKKALRKQLQEMTDEVMADAIGQMEACSARLAEAKKAVIDTFGTLMQLRKEVNEEEGKREQDSFSFTNTEGTQRIRIGYNMNDGYLDEVEEGIAKVKAYLESLAKDEAGRKLIGMVMQLMARNDKGNLKASRVIQLSKIAEESGDETFMEGIKIIREAYRPTRTKLFIRCSVRKEDKDGQGEWSDIPLGITEVEV